MTDNPFATRVVTVDLDAMQKSQERMTSALGDVTTVAESCRQTREAFGLTRKGLAEESNVSESRIGAIETGSSPSGIALVEALQILSAFIMYGKESDARQPQLDDAKGSPEKEET